MRASPPTRDVGSPSPSSCSRCLIVVLDNTVLNVAIPTILREFDTDAPEPPVGDHRLLADVRHAADHRRPARRHLRRTAACSSSAPRCSASARCSRPCRHSVPTLVARRGDHRGHRRLADDAGDAGHPVDDVRAAASGPRRSRSWGATAGARGRVRPARRWLPHDQLLVAVVVPDQRDRRPARDHRRAALHAADARPPAGAQRIDIPGALLDRRRHVPARVRAQRGRRLRLAAAAADLSIGGPGGRGQRRAPISVVPVAFVVAVVLLACFYVYERRKERARRAIRCSSSASCAISASATGCSPRWCSRWASSASCSSCPVFLQDGQHLSAVENGLWLLPIGRCSSCSVRQLGGRLTPSHRHDPRRAFRSRARSGRPRAWSPRGDLADTHVAGVAARASRSSASGSASPARS